MDSLMYIFQLIGIATVTIFTFLGLLLTWEHLFPTKDPRYMRRR
jgi:hypothetical protein